MSNNVNDFCYKEITYICKKSGKEAKWIGTVRLLKYSGWVKKIITIKNLDNGKI
jgi:hypothetical protein